MAGEEDEEKIEVEEKEEMEEKEVPLDEIELPKIPNLGKILGDVDEFRKGIKKDIEEGMNIGEALDKNIREEASERIDEFRPFNISFDFKGPGSTGETSISLEFGEKEENE